MSEKTGGYMEYNYEEIVNPLLKWYDKNARTLPWREEPKPYYVWISEIMLQQTRVEAVKSYFQRFIVELPDVQSLAQVQEDKLLKLWEGLGYYNRARNLKKAACQIVEQYGGVLPNDYDKLLQLSGVGSYTAGAIASIAFQIKVPAVDGNVLRVTKRLAGSFDDILKADTKKRLEQTLKQIMPDRPGDFNQALMELGALICIPNGKPLCIQCPLQERCIGNKKELTNQIPVKTPKKPRKIEEKTVLILEHQGKYALHKRGKKGLLAGLWELPNMDGKLDKKEMEDFLQDSNLLIHHIEEVGEAKHIFSHIEWHMLGYYIKLEELVSETSFTWVDKENIEKDYALPTAFHYFQDRLI